MNPKPKKSSLKGKDPDDLIERAIQDGLSEDKSGINNKPILKELAPSSKPRYAKIISVWVTLVLLLQISIQEPVLTTYRYERRFHSSNPRNMETMKHIK